MQTTLADLKVGDKVIVKRINVVGSLRRRLLDMGLIEGTRVECVLISPGGNPIAYLIRGAVVAIRKEDSKNILVEYVK